VNLQCQDTLLLFPTINYYATVDATILKLGLPPMGMTGLQSSAECDTGTLLEMTSECLLLLESN